MSKFEFCSYCTIFDGSANGIRFPNPYKEEVCFFSSLSYLDQQINDAKYSIILIKDTSLVQKQKDNYCWMTKHQLENYLRRIASLKPFKYIVIDSEYKGSPCYQVDLSIKGTKKEILFVLQALRRSYEFPYSFYLLQAYKLQSLKKYRFESIFNLFNVAFSAYSHEISSGHNFSGCKAFETYHTLRTRLPKIKDTSQLYSNPMVPPTKVVRFPDITYCDNAPNDIDQWTDELFEKMLPTYVENFKHLKR